MVDLTKSKSELEAEVTHGINVSYYAQFVMCLGGLMMLAGAVVTGVQLWNYYGREMLPIPLMIVDEADIVTYVTDKDGNQLYEDNGEPQMSIDFDQFAYYEVVKCNRQNIGVNSKAQDGVDQYAEWGCGDAADLNCDIGKQWLALYTVKSAAKGDPILADSLTYYLPGDDAISDASPNGCTQNLHFFTYTYAADLADTAYCFNREKGSIYLYWDSDAKAFAQASSFTGGQLALACIGGLAAGILCATVVTMITKKRKETPETPAVA